MKSLPVSYVTDPFLLYFPTYDVVFSCDYFKKVLSKLVELVEKRIAKMMEQSDREFSFTRLFFLARAEPRGPT